MLCTSQDLAKAVSLQAGPGDQATLGAAPFCFSPIRHEAETTEAHQQHCLSEGSGTKPDFVRSPVRQTKDRPKAVSIIEAAK